MLAATRHLNPTVSRSSLREDGAGRARTSRGGPRVTRGKRSLVLAALVSVLTLCFSFSVRTSEAAADVTGPCLLGSFGAGAWPGACWQPYSPASPFNRPLPANPRVSPDSNGIIWRMLSQTSRPYPSELEARNDYSFGEPTYYPKSTDPEFTIHCTRTSWGRCAVEGMSVRIPAGAKPEGGVASCNSDSCPDAHITVVDQAQNREYDLWQVQQSPIPTSGGTLNVSWGGYTSMTGSGADGQGDATGSHWADLAGRVRAEEMEAGEIDHALFIDIRCDNGSHVYPARSHGARCSDPTNAPPLGTRLQLDYTPAEIFGLHVPGWQKPILIAMAKYGMYFGDTGTRNLFNIEVESDLQYTSMGQPPKWLPLAKANHWAYWDGEGGMYTGKFKHSVDWSRLRVIDPCVTAGTC
jgi:hypothetical protein